MRQLVIREGREEEFVLDSAGILSYHEGELPDSRMRMHASRRAINLAMAAKAYAFIKRRGYVIPEDVRAVAPDVMRHRIGLTYEAEAENITTEEIINEILNIVEVP